MREIILASTSMYRRELLSRLQVPFSIAAPNIDETRLEYETAHDMVLRLSLQKAQVVAKQHPNALIIGSDQCATLEQHILGKPGNHANATLQLQQCSGKSVQFLTGLCLFDSSDQTYQLSIVPFSVTLRVLSTAMIEHYLVREQPYDCAGSFKAEGLGISLFTQMHGDDPSALIGLPLIQLTHMLAQKQIILPLP